MGSGLRRRPFAGLSQRLGLPAVAKRGKATPDPPTASADLQREPAVGPSGDSSEAATETNAEAHRHVTDEELFLREVADVRPLARNDANLPQRQPTDSDPATAVHDDWLVVDELDALVDGRGEFDSTWSDEHIEGIARGVDRKLLRKLRKGGYSVGAHIDLHGHTRLEARPAVEQFLIDARRRGCRCVLIVHGRGLHSKGRIPVLKEAVQSWLMRGRISKIVLAFSSARPTDGGMGAVYVLLRR